MKLSDLSISSMLCAVALSSSISRTRIQIPFSAAGTSSRSRPYRPSATESEAAIEWLTKPNFVWKTISEILTGAYTLLNPNMNHTVNILTRRIN
ncbi:protein of unknown function [Aminobacter niigataensis]|nr:protein of unknown function [Aminobacter niigataensis]